MSRNLPAARLRLTPFAEPPLAAMGELIFGTAQHWARFQQQFPPMVRIRLRIMTDDPELAMLPWQRLMHPETEQPLLDTGWMIETGPVVATGQLRFTNINPANPLLVIPTAEAQALGGKSHHNLLQQHLHSELGIIGSIQQVHSAHSVKHALKYHEPDLIYIYAPFDGQNIQLDPDPRSIHSQAGLTLEQLGEWLQEFKLYPLVVLTLLGCPPKTYPATLIKNSSMVWLQQDSKNPRGAARMSDNLFDILAKIPNNGDLLQVITQASLKLAADNAHHVWVNGYAPIIALPNGNQHHYSRLRAALLRVMLGRKSLKDQLYGAITRSDNFDKQAFLVFAVSGNADACPFEFPAQLRSRLQWEDSKNRFPVIQFDFPLSTIKGDYYDLKAGIETAIDENMRHNHDDIGDILKRQRGGARRGQDCCIVLNWLLDMDELDEVVLTQWLGVWQRTLHFELARHIPEQTVLVAVACLQLPDEDTAQTAQQVANEALYNTKPDRVQTIEVEDALGCLKALEIRQFLDKGTRWYTDLKLVENRVEPQAYSRWIHQRTQGRFEQTVDHLWQQYQRHYQDYLAT